MIDDDHFFSDEGNDRFMHFHTMIKDTITNDTMSNDLMINPSRIRSSAASMNNEDPLCCCEYREILNFLIINIWITNFTAKKGRNK